ncbi:MAG: DUF167 domain-containing protein [Candidatus Dojkabacteria bacterium]|nr:DUF167 domain-containing protein [Candidatus Dojkabacteria bacterium]
MKKILQVKVKIGNRKEGVEFKDGIYFIYINSPARNNLANISVIDLLSEYLDIPKSYISIKKGLKSKNKIIEINDD